VAVQVKKPVKFVKDPGKWFKEKPGKEKKVIKHYPAIHVEVPVL
jgi:hypothetical protein